MWYENANLRIEHSHVHSSNWEGNNQFPAFIAQDFSDFNGLNVGLTIDVSSTITLMVRPSHRECRVARGGGVELNTPFTELKGFTGSKPNKPIVYTGLGRKIKKFNAK